MDRRSISHIAIVVILIIIVVFFIPNFILKTTYSFADNHTLSRKGHTTWIYFINTNDWYVESPIEATLKSKNNKIDYDWVSYEGTGYSIFNTPSVRGHGRPNRLALHMKYPGAYAEIGKMSANEQLDIYSKLIKNDHSVIDETIKHLLSSE